MLETLIIIGPLFIIIFVSAVIQRFMKLGTDWIRVLNDYALYIGFPALILAALAKIRFSFDNHGDLLIVNSFFLLSSFLLTFLGCKLFVSSIRLRSTIFICLPFGNVAYLGIPVLVNIFGNEIVSDASLIVAVYLFWIFTLGISVIDYSTGLKKSHRIAKVISAIIKNPLLIAVILGILIGSFQISIPNFIWKAVEMISASTVPIVLVVIGLFIGRSEIGKLSEWISIFIFSILTLFVLPILFYFGLQVLGYSVSEFGSSILESAMPLAITPFALADKFKLDKEFIARSVVLSTILSVLSISFWKSVLF